jgi:hypothetical protein
MVDGEGDEVALVHTDQVRSCGERDFELILVVYLDEYVEADRRCDGVKVHHLV